MTEKTKADCRGCRNDFYNGNNGLGVRECWSFKDATFVMKKEVHINQVPPWNQPASRMLSCFHRPQFINVSPECTT